MLDEKTPETNEEVNNEVIPENVENATEKPVKTRIQKLVDCERCGKSMTAKSLKYYHTANCPNIDENSKQEARNAIDKKKQAVKDKKKEYDDKVIQEYLNKTQNENNNNDSGTVDNITPPPPPPVDSGTRASETPPATPKPKPNAIPVSWAFTL